MGLSVYMRTFRHVIQSMLTTSCTQWGRWSFGHMVSAWPLEGQGTNLSRWCGLPCLYPWLRIKTLDTEAWWASVVGNIPSTLSHITAGRNKYCPHWQPIPTFLPEESRGPRSLVGYSSLGRSRTRLSDWAHGIAFSSAGRSPLPCLSCTLPYVPLPVGDFNLCLLVGINHNCE